MEAYVPFSRGQSELRLVKRTVSKDVMMKASVVALFYDLYSRWADR